jgi:hypothetical protein
MRHGKIITITMKHFKLFEQFVNESLPSHIETAAKDLAHSMPNHTAPDRDGKFSDEQIIKAFKYIPALKQLKGKNVDDVVKKVQEILAD